MGKKAYVKAFTIIELIIVIAIISILALITIVSYNSLNNKARITSIQSDLVNDAGLMKSYYALYGSYPTAFNASNCPTAPTADANYCLRASNGNSLVSYTGTSSSFNLKLGSGTLYYQITESTPPSTATVVAQINMGNGGCLLSSLSGAYCWGFNGSGENGTGAGGGNLSPVPILTTGVLSGKTIAYIGRGSDFSCALTVDSKLYCWGYGGLGELGNGLTANSSSAVTVNMTGILAGKTINSLAVGSDSSCVIASDSQAYCWGWGVKGTMGDGLGTTTNANPVAVSTSGVLSGKTLKKISVGAYSACAIASDNQAYCWGGNANGQLGNNSVAQSNIPVAVDTSGVLAGLTITDISVGYASACALASNNLMYCWGGNSNGQLGNGTTTASLVPTPVTMNGSLLGKTISFFSTSHTEFSDNVCAVASDGLAYCWGYNSFGSLGNNGGAYANLPTAVYAAGVLSGRSISAITVGSYSGCVLTVGVPYCWGEGGTTGTGSASDALIPTALALPF